MTRLARKIRNAITVVAASICLYLMMLDDLADILTFGDHTAITILVFCLGIVLSDSLKDAHYQEEIEKLKREADRECRRQVYIAESEAQLKRALGE